jgi:hypothetical protein
VSCAPARWLSAVLARHRSRERGMRVMVTPGTLVVQLYRYMAI